MFIVSLGVFMRVCVVSNADLNKFLKGIKPSLQRVDLVLLSFKVFSEINYQSEIENKTESIKQIITLSKELNCIVMAASNYNLFGKNYSSVLVSDRGHLLGIADSVYPISDKTAGKELKIFKTKLGKIGVIVNEDILNIKVAKILKKFGAKFLINICDFFDLEKQNKAVNEAGKLADVNLLSINPACSVFYSKKTQKVKINFCEFFTKDYKI
jgi:hypothetical protein